MAESPRLIPPQAPLPAPVAAGPKVTGLAAVPSTTSAESSRIRIPVPAANLTLTPALTLRVAPLVTTTLCVTLWSVVHVVSLTTRRLDFISTVAASNDALSRGGRLSITPRFGSTKKSRTLPSTSANFTVPQKFLGASITTVDGLALASSYLLFALVKILSSILGCPEATTVTSLTDLSSLLLNTFRRIVETSVLSDEYSANRIPLPPALPVTVLSSKRMAFSFATRCRAAFDQAAVLAGLVSRVFSHSAQAQLESEGSKLCRSQRPSRLQHGY